MIFHSVSYPSNIKTIHCLGNAGMAPHPGIDTDHIREKARKDLLDLLEGVCKARQRIHQTPGRC